MFKNWLHFYIAIMNNQKEKLRKQFHLQLHQKKCLEINLTKEVKHLYSNTSKKEIDKDINKWKHILCSQIE